MSWQSSLRKTASRLNESGRCRLAVVCIGHEMRGDDAAGPVIARRLLTLAGDSLLVVSGSHAPENHTGPIRRFRPDFILFVDSAQLDAEPGTIAWLPWQATSGVSASPHTLPLVLLARYLTTELACEIALIGIQPGRNDIGAPLTAPVAAAVEEVVKAIELLASTSLSPNNSSSENHENQ